MSNFVLTNERTYYEQEDLWNRPIDATNRDRVLATLRLIPDGIASVLDVGSGQGIVTNPLTTHVKTTAFDLSATALRQISPTANRVQGSGLELPFRDRSFDLVLSSEVIEHFPDREQAQIVAELRRVAKKFLLIGVPAEEDIRGATVTCPKCGANYHVNHHYRSYTENMMRGLTGWNMVSLGACGGTRALVHPFLRALGRKAGGTFETPHALCPQCAAPYPVHPQAAPSIALKAANVAWRRATGRNRLRSHWIALYSAPGVAAPTFELGNRIAVQAAESMHSAQVAFAFGKGLVEPGSVAHLIEGNRPGWNVLAWPREFMRALRSRAGFYVAADLPGRLLAIFAARVRGGRVLAGKNKLFVAKDFRS